MPNFLFMKLGINNFETELWPILFNDGSWDGGMDEQQIQLPDLGEMQRRGQ